MIGRHSRIVDRVSNAIRKKKISNRQKKVDLQFPRKVVILIHSFPKTTRNARIAKPYFPPCSEEEMFKKYFYTTRVYPKLM